jgi:hypothetical protein
LHPNVSHDPDEWNKATSDAGNHNHQTVYDESAGHVKTIILKVCYEIQPLIRPVCSTHFHGCAGLGAAHGISE